MILVTVIVAIVLVGSFLAYTEVSKKTVSPSSTGKITVKDSLGRTVTFNHTLTRIISIDPSATATLYALGAYKDLVGGNEFDCYPPNESLPNVGNACGIDLEEILNLNPQVVLLYGSTMPSYGYELLNYSIPVLVDNPENIQEIENETTMFGILTGTELNASLINNWINVSLNTISNDMSNVNSTSEFSAFYYLSEGDWTAGNGTFISQIMQYAHLKNIANATGYYQMSPELIAADNPQVIILDQYVPFGAVNSPPFNETSAYYNNRVVSVVNDSFFEEPDFRIVYGAAWLANQVYPNFISLPQFPIKLEYSPTMGL